MSRIVFVDTEVSTESGRVCFHITAAKTTQMPVLKWKNLLRTGILHI